MIGEYKLIPKGITVWSIALQENITFDKDIIIEITNTVIKSESVFGKMKLLLFNHIGQIPTLIDKHNGDICVDYKDTIPYTIPESYGFEYLFKGKEI